MVLPRKSSTVTRVIGTLAILIILQAVVQLRYGPNPLTVAQFLPSGSVHLGPGVVVPTSRVVLVIVALILATALAVIYSRTTFGLATTAVSERPRTLSALGWRIGRVGIVNWGIGGALSGLAGVLLTPLIGASLTNGSLLTITILAAALIGGLRSFPLTVVGGMIIGMLQSVFGIHDLGVTGLADAIPLLVIIAVIVWRGRNLPLRSFIGERLPRVGTGKLNIGAIVIAVAVTAGLITWVLSDNGNVALTTSLLAAIPMLSLTVVLGYAGQMSLAQLSLSGIGGLIAARLTANAGLPFLVVLLAAMLGAVPVGLIVGLPSARTRGVSLAITTLGLAVAIQALIFNNDRISGGTTGIPLSSDGSFVIFGVDFDSFLYPARFAYLVLGFVLVIALVVANLRRGGSGRRMIAVRDNERAAAGLGINVVTTKLWAFGVASAIAGLGGALTIFTASVGLFTGFTILSNISTVGYAVIGGVGSVPGALFGSTLVPSGFGSLILDAIIHVSPVTMGLIGGVLLIFTIVTSPDGIAQATIDSLAPVRRNVRSAQQMLRRRHATSPALPASDDVPFERVTPAALSVRSITVAFDVVLAVDGVDLEVHPGEVVGVIGANGAGKTTLIDAITGFVPCTGGIELGGRDLTSLSTSARGRSGLGRSWQSLELIEDLTVGENLRVASDTTAWWSVLADLIRPGRSKPSPTMLRVVHALRLGDLLDSMPKELSTGQRKLVALARAIASEPSVLLLDEPCSGLDQHERTEVGVVIRSLADDWGVGVLLVEHDTQLVRAVSDRLIALDFGQVVATGSPDDVLSHPQVIRAYLGESAVEPVEVSTQIEEPAL
jgi:ABC-type branched-subunit amino acid transport system ATPase component/ABC-type branched-subunit amino acid transport system permease subunit